MIVDASHERLCGKDTDVGKMLRALGKKRLRIVDSKRPNVVFIMTHVCGIPPGQWDTKLNTKAYCLQLLGRRYLKLQAPVVYIENDYVAWGLNLDEEWSVLPNGERQPLNLFNECIEVMRKNQDEVGIEAVRLYYENSRNIPLNVVNRVKGELYTNETKLCDSTTYWLNKIMSPIKCTEVTEVDLKIDQFIKENQKTEKDIDLELFPLKFILQKNKLTEVEKIKSLTLPEIESTLIPYRLSNLEKHVICQLFTPIPPKPEKIAPALGCGYNILENKILESVFDTSQLRKVPEHNLILPTGTVIHEYFNTEATCRGVKSFADFAQDKLAAFGKYSSLAKFPLPSGYNIIDPNSVSKKDCKITFRIEQTVFRIQLFPCCDFPLCKGFIDDVRRLPENFYEDDDDTVHAFSKFFTKYGNWVIGQTTLGGYIEGVMRVERENALREDYYTIIRKLVITHIGNIVNGAHFDETFDRTDTLVEEMKVYQNLVEAELSWFGGDGRYHVPTLKQMSRKSWNAWTESLKLNPVTIPYSYIPIPLHLILYSHNNASSSPVQRAYEFLTGRTSSTKSFSLKRLLGLSTQPKTRAQASENVMSDIVDDSCFPGSSTVLLSTGRIVCMRDLHIGDKILSVDSEGRTCFSPLYLWGHLDPERDTDYLCIGYGDGELRVSENHLVFVSRGGGGRREPVPAVRVCVGDNLEFVCGSCRDVMRSVEVLSVRCIRDKGVYSPFTLNSCLVVDGVLCSVFSVPPGVAQDVSQVHKIGHALFTPLRLAYKTDLCKSISYMMNTTDNMHSYCSALRFAYLTMKPIESLLFGNS